MDNGTDISRIDSQSFSAIEADSIFDRVELGGFDRWNLTNLKKRDDVYLDILEKYRSYIEILLSRNPRRQTVFLIISTALLIISPIQFIVCLLVFGDSQNIAALIASAAEVVSSLLVFPKIIAQYLFNTNETTNINNVVEAIQNFDIEIRSGIRHTAESHFDAVSESNNVEEK